MHQVGKYKVFRRARRGQALIIALALIFCVMMMASVTQVLVMTQLAASKRERDYERALQMAEAGANAYMNELANGFVNGTYSYMPAWNPLTANPNGDTFPITCSALKSRVLASTYAITKYPANSQQGFFVGHTTNTGGTVNVVSYGWSNGVVRRIQIGAQAISIFDSTAIYGLDPLPNDYCWKFTGNASVIGPCGGEGVIDTKGKGTYYDGPVIFSGPGAASNQQPAVLTSSTGTPSGHVGTGALASPLYISNASSIHLPTADQAANAWALSSKNITTTQGVEYFRSHNDNSTGIRYLVQDSTTNVIREISGNYTVLSAGDYQLDTEFSPSKNALTQLGMTNKESFYGLRFYPGDYFFEQISMGPKDVMFMRSFSDAERNSVSRAFVVSGDPANPNAGQATNGSVRFWIGKAAGGKDAATTFESNTSMEYTAYASRFRVYVANTAGVTVHGKQGSATFRLNILDYNRDANGNGYGSIKFNSNTYVYGSLIAWQVDMSGGVTIEKDTTLSGTNSDILKYNVTSWKELP